MKTTYLMLGFLFLFGQLFSQKGQVTMTANLNLSKSNINRLIYPGNILSPAKAQSLLADLEKANPPDEAAQKTWLAANFKRFGIAPEQIKEIFFFAGRQYADCTSCMKSCKGRCVQDPGSDCVCVYHNPPSEPNLRTTQSEKSFTIIFLSAGMMEEATAMETVSNAMASAQRSTTVKSSKSNSSE